MGCPHGFRTPGGYTNAAVRPNPRAGTSCRLARVSFGVLGGLAFVGVAVVAAVIAVACFLAPVGFGSRCEVAEVVMGRVLGAGLGQLGEREPCDRGPVVGE